MLNGSLFDTKKVDLSSGETKEVIFNLTLIIRGRYLVNIGEKTLELIVRKAQINLIIEFIDFPEKITQNDVHEVNFNVKNIGNLTAINYIIQIKLDNNILEEYQIENIAPSEVLTDSFNFMPEEDGIHLLSAIIFDPNNNIIENSDVIHIDVYSDTLNYQYFFVVLLLSSLGYIYYKSKHN